MKPDMHKALKEAARHRGLSLNAYLLARIFSPGPIVLRGDFVVEPMSKGDFTTGSDPPKS